MASQPHTCDANNLSVLKRKLFVFISEIMWSCLSLYLRLCCPVSGMGGFLDLDALKTVSTLSSGEMCPTIPAHGKGRMFMCKYHSDTWCRYSL